MQDLDERWRQHKKTNSNCIDIDVLGGKLQIKFEFDGNGYKNIFLIGEALQVFYGEIEI